MRGDKYNPNRKRGKKYFPRRKKNHVSHLAFRGAMSEERVPLVGSDGDINLEVWQRLKADLLINQWTLTEPTGL